MSAPDQFFDQINAELVTVDAPYDPVSDNGDSDDTAHYLYRPGTDFYRPWLAVRNGPAFQWPLGMQGFSDVITPSLGIHKPLGGSKVAVDVLHSGEEHFTLSGYFPGKSAPALVKALRQVIYYDAPDEGKILYLPEIADHPWRVQLVNSSFDRGQDDRGRDTTYSIEFVRLGILGDISTPGPPPPPGARIVKVDAKHNTLRILADWKLGSANKWRVFYDLNTKMLDKWMKKNGVTFAKLPSHKLPIGMKLKY